MIGVTILPFINSPHFGTGLGVISTSPYPHGVISHSLGQRSGGEITERGLLAHRESAERAIAEGEEERQGLRHGKYDDATHRIAGVVRDFGREWVVFRWGTAVPLHPDAMPIESPGQFAAAFGEYPFHRIRTDPHRELMSCHLLAQKIGDDATRAKASRATRQLLEEGYPKPGCGDRYVFMPRRDTGFVWVVDDGRALGEFRTRDSTAEERSLIANAESAEAIPTIDDPSMDAYLVQSPLTIAMLDLSKTPTVSRSDVYRGASEHGIENRRLDYMFPLPVALISPEGSIEIF